MGTDAKKPPEGGIEYSWSGVGELKIMFQGPRTAVLRFDPERCIQGRTKPAKEGDSEPTLLHQGSGKTVPTDGQTISEALEKLIEKDATESWGGD